MTISKHWLMPLLLILSLVGCDSNNHGDTSQQDKTSKQSKVSKKAAESDTVSVMGDAVNYMHKFDVKYTLYDLNQTPPVAIGGAIVDPLSQGGSKGCCISLPKKWHEGMKVRIDWGRSDREGKYEQPSQELEIPYYDVAAGLYVVFHDNNEIELVVSKAGPGHPEWRGRIKQTPWEACVAKNGRKPCFMALPKLFDTRSYQGYCTSLKRKNRFTADDKCRSLMYMCMKDYEDQAFCDDVLWGRERTCDEVMSDDYCKNKRDQWEAMQ